MISGPRRVLQRLFFLASSTRSSFSMAPVASILCFSSKARNSRTLKVLNSALRSFGSASAAASSGGASFSLA